MTKLLTMLQKNVMLVVAAVAMIVVMYLIAFISEKLIEKKSQIKFSSEKTKINKMVFMAMLSAVALVLMYFDFPLPIAPSFYKIDFSEVPVLIGSFILGPCAGVLIEAVKVILHICLKGTQTAFVGDFANFILGCAFVVPASIIYHTKKTRTRAIIGLVVGSVIFMISGMVLNAVYLLPTYSVLYGMPIETLIAMGTKINKGINNVFTFVAFAVLPFNFIKSVVSSVITAFLYKFLNRLMK